MVVRSRRSQTASARERSSRGAALGTLSVNGQASQIADSELPRDTWADARRDVPLRAGWNEVRFESAAQLEVIRFRAFTLDRTDLPAEWRLAYDDGWYVVIETRSDAAAR